MIKNQIVELQDLLAKLFEYKPNDWKDEIIDPEGDLSQEATPFTEERAMKFERAIEYAHERLNDIVLYTEGNDRIIKDLRFQFLLLKAFNKSGLTSNMFVDSFEDLSGVNVVAGEFDPEQRRVYLP